MPHADNLYPYSNATRGNVQVTLSVDGTPIEPAVEGWEAMHR